MARWGARLPQSVVAEELWEAGGWLMVDGSGTG